MLNVNNLNIMLPYNIQLEFYKESVEKAIMILENEAKFQREHNDYDSLKNELDEGDILSDNEYSSVTNDFQEPDTKPSSAVVLESDSESDNDQIKKNKLK